MIFDFLKNLAEVDFQLIDGSTEVHFHLFFFNKKAEEKEKEK